MTKPIIDGLTAKNAIDSINWKCPNGLLDDRECYTLAHDLVKDWMK